MSPRNIDENKLDELLRDLYLEEHSEAINEEEANFVFAQDYPVAINSKKEKELLIKLGVKQQRTWMKWLLIIILAIGVLVSLYFYFRNDHTSNPVSKPILKSEKTKQEQNSTTDTIQYSNRPVVNFKDTFGKPKLIALIKPDSIKPGIQTENVAPEPKEEKTVPFISDYDKIKYSKVKDQMIQHLLKRDKALYTFIPAAKTDYKNEEVILDAFTIRNVGISNLEYKTFLADLLAQGRNQEYLIADIRNNGWLINGYSHLASFYFSDEKYNDFPVVNITKEGVVLFCTWLQEEIEKYVKKNKIKYDNLKIRLPYDEEWIYAAREGYAKIAFDKGYNTIYDESEGLVNKAFTKRAELVKKRVKRIDTLYTQYTTNRYGWKEKEIIEFLNKGFAYCPPTPADTINTDRMKVFGKLGRVSEIVYQKDAKRIWFTGLNWSSKEIYQKLEKEFMLNEHSPFVGFRIVVINPDDPEYKNPFW